MIEPDYVVWLRDLDGTGSMHPCAPHDKGAIRYVCEGPEWPWASRHGRLRARIIEETAEGVEIEFSHLSEPCPQGRVTLPKSQFNGLYVLAGTGK